MASKNTTYKEGYTPARTREVTPAEFEQLPADPIERPIVIRTSGLLRWQDVVAIGTLNDGDYITDDTFDSDPIAGSALCLTVNGQTYVSANGSAQVAESSFYVTNSTGTIVRSHGSYSSGDRFRWNGSVAGYELEDTDILKIAYEV